MSTKAWAIHFDFDLYEDQGRIVPHRGKYPPVVERALFWLALAPWEEWVERVGFDWRCFDVPWVYTIDHDLFSTMKCPPSSDTLSWEDHIVQGDNGDHIELTRPITIWLTGAAKASLSDHFGSRAVAMNTFEQLQLLQTPVVHFFTRAFLSEGIDEFLAHLLAIEAGLGMQGDHKRKDSKGREVHQRLGGATERMVARLTALLDGAAGESYKQLFKKRSEFLHGRSMQDIPSRERVLARTLSRRVVDALVLVNQIVPEIDRGQYLDDLLDEGALLISARNNGS